MSDVIVLMYHHISHAEDVHSVTIENFRSQLTTLSSSGYHLLSGTDFQAWREGKLHLERQAVLLTFDDGWLDNWVHALPLLQQFKMPAIFFVVTGWPGEGSPRTVTEIANWRCPTHAESMKTVADEKARDNVVMRWSELLAARETGLICLQSHSHSHGEWWQGDADWPERLVCMEQDLARSREVFSERVGQYPEQLCWPRGQFTLDMVYRAQRLGFSHQFSTLRGGNKPQPARLIRRIHVENLSGEWLAGKIKLFANPLTGSILGYAHQLLYRRRMEKMLKGRIPRHELFLPYWRLV